MILGKGTSANLLTSLHYRHHWQKFRFCQVGVKAVERAALFWNPSVLSPQWIFLICSSEHNFSTSKHHFVRTIHDQSSMVTALSQCRFRGKIKQCAWWSLKSYIHMEILASLKTLLSWLTLRNCPVAFLVKSLLVIGKKRKFLECKSHFFTRWNAA